MKSGLEGRNNRHNTGHHEYERDHGLNEVRPRRPEQSYVLQYQRGILPRLNEVRPRRPEQFLASWLSMLLIALSQ